MTIKHKPSLTFPFSSPPFVPHTPQPPPQKPTPHHTSNPTPTPTHTPNTTPTSNHTHPNPPPPPPLHKKTPYPKNPKEASLLPSPSRSPPFLSHLSHKFRKVSRSLNLHGDGAKGRRVVKPESGLRGLWNRDCGFGFRMGGLGGEGGLGGGEGGGGGCLDLVFGGGG